ncbi:oxidoreductase [Cedecea neteri]|uniref:Flagellin modification protein A n=1 Tax=Cedecea neteri TaxID=158822 RepID=A0A291DW99_9ENTR|nr:oxidoreductase [Cedecea neteri]ATF91962.1 flagellin modification protein A [Cedecea neteri]
MINNKKILILGAGGLLGSCLVTECLKRGGSVIAVDSDIERMNQRLATLGVDLSSDKLEIAALNVTNDSDVKAFFSKLCAIDGVVNATYPRNKSYGAHFFDVTLDGFNDNLSLHLGSTFLLMQQCALYFKQKEKPLSVVNISSVYGVIAPRFEIYENTKMTMPVEYAAIKSALLHLNKYVVAYVKDTRFRINAVSPGGIFDNQPEEFLEAYKAYTNGKGMLEVSGVIGAVLYFLSDESKYVTAQNLIVDDGFHL